MRQFLSTLSLRRATVTRVASTPTTVISIHALLAESDAVSVQVGGNVRYFYPRSPCGERQLKKLFLSVYLVISIHALLAESDSKSAQNSGALFAHMKQILWGLHLHADRQGCILPFLSLFFHIFWCEGTGNFMIAFPSH